LDFNWEIKPDSDHYTFFSRGVPYLMLHTGMHNDYHRPSDDADKINSEGLTKVAQLLFNVVLELADATAPAAFRRKARGETRFDQQATERALPPLPGRLGVTWDEKAAKEGTIRLTAVTPHGAAAKGGLKPGDRLLKFSNREMHSAEEFRLAILTAKSPVSVILERKGDEKPIELSIPLPGDPVRMGISWRTDDAEPGSVIVNRITPGSPADLAKLQINDRIYRIGGRPFANGDEFRLLASGMSDTLVLEVESAGRIHTVEIPPLPAEPTADPVPTPMESTETPESP
jgi:C-terminal processing protease CtpA/Prc